MADLWPQKHIDALRGYMADRSGSHADIAALLNGQFRTNYSRNAVIGKCGRLGLAGNSPPNGRGVRTRKPKPRTVPAKPEKSATNSPEAVQLRCVEVDPRLIRIYELTDETCRWPYGEVPPLTYCGHPVFEGSYCGAHFYLSTRSN